LRAIPEGETVISFSKEQRGNGRQESTKCIIWKKLALPAKIIAVVDDNELLLNAVRSFFEAYGARVLTYKAGHDFLKEMPVVDCGVVDFYMRFLDGLALVSELRKRGDDTPVILFTGLRNEIPEDRLAGSNVREVVDKLSGYEELLRAVQDAVGAGRSDRQSGSNSESM
jgi:FixJ family two-component response regulator